eukprot:TRINITY_DN2765_c0_g6_i1.p2 TRINITY_DN2765_c0_g6~~TRINITY_DN2765_c0_g6_i1.p2  ORF type:complete len:349 (+),score=114.07 TRINITY_DN2765_c0_g6_i1:83-1129(+)
MAEPGGFASTGPLSQPTLSQLDAEGLPITQDALELRLQPAPTFTATSCPHCDNVFEVAIDFEEIKDNVEFERLKKKELETQKEAYKQEITRFQEEVNSLKETLANLCNQLAQAQVENLRSKQSSLEQDNYIKQLKDHLKQSEEELHSLAHDFELALERNKELQAAHLRNTGKLPSQQYTSNTARKITEGKTSVGPALPGGSGGGVPEASTPGGGQGQSQGFPPPGHNVSALASNYGPQQNRFQPNTSVGQSYNEKQERYRQQLYQFYSIHNPNKISDIDSILREFAGHEEDMLVMLARKYCAPPLSPNAHLPRNTGPGYVPQPEDDDQLRQVAPWTLQMAQSRRHGSY